MITSHRFAGHSCRTWGDERWWPAGLRPLRRWRARSARLPIAAATLRLRTNNPLSLHRWRSPLGGEIPPHRLAPHGRGWEGQPVRAV